MLKKIISGGQTGADQGALHGARRAGLETGGTAPKGYRTELGPNPDLLKRYNLVESQDFSYAARTKKNVLESDATILFGDATSSGSALTFNLCAIYGKGCFVIQSPEHAENIDYLISWIKTWQIRVLNVAGNRESKNPGIYKATSDFVVALVKELEKE